MFLLFWSLFLSRFCVQILLSFLNPFVNCGIDLDKIILLLVLCILLVPPTPLVTRCPGSPYSSGEEQESDASFLTTHPDNVLGSNLPKRPTDILSLHRPYLVGHFLNQGWRAKGQTALWKQYQGFSKGVSSGQRGLQKVPLDEENKATLWQSYPDTLLWISPRGPLHKPYQVARTSFSTNTYHLPCFLLLKLTTERDQSPSFATLQRDKTTGPFNLKYYLFKTQQANMGEQSS